MFTGLVEATARVAAIEDRPDGRRLAVATLLGADLRPGDSIAVNGVCLTAVSVAPDRFAADVSAETLRLTTIGSFVAGRLVNLERPIRPDGRLGGHFVLGHVDGTGRIAALDRDGDAAWLRVDCGADLAPYLVRKGSVAVDGVSLTVAALDARGFGIQIVPFTLAHTALAEAAVGDAVNLETDIIGKYVVRLLREAPEALGAVTPLRT